MSSLTEGDFCSLSVIGDGATGKSSIINSFKTDGFVANYKQTIGIDFFEKKLKIRDQYLSLRVFDVGGQSINSNNLGNYVANSDIVFLNYDVTNRESFANLDDWLLRLRQCSIKNQKLYLIGNKIDLYNLRQVNEKDHQIFLEENKFSGGFFMSAKTGEHVVRSFYQVAAESKGIKLSPSDLATWDKVLKAHIILEKSNDDKNTSEGRTEWADEIERQDKEAERKRLQGNRCCCS